MKRIIKYILIIFIIYISIISCSTTSNHTLETVIIPEDFLGLVHAGQSNTEKEYQLIDELGADWILNTFYWSGIEKEKGNFNYSSYDNFADFAKKNNKKVIAVLAYSTDWVNENRYISGENIKYFLDYVEMTVKHYKGKVDAWQIWNEPNWIFWKGKNKEFYELSKQAAQTIRNADPDAYIIGGGYSRVPASFIRGMKKAGAIENLDAISFHPYAMSPKGAIYLYDNFIKISKDINYKGETWITEVGYPSAGWYPTKVSLKNLPSYVIKTIVPSSARGARTLFWYELFDRYNPGEEIKKNESEYYFGLVYPNYTKKNGAWAYSLCGRFLPGTKYMPKLPLRDKVPSNIISFCFTDGASGYNSLILWNDICGSKKIKITLSSNFTVHSISSKDSTEMLDGSVISVTNTPVFITWKGNNTSPQITGKIK